MVTGASQPDIQIFQLGTDDSMPYFVEARNGPRVYSLESMQDDSPSGSDGGRIFEKVVQQHIIKFKT
jgi:hypothetical protein